MSSEVIAWVIIAGVTVAYLREAQVDVLPEVAIPSRPSQAREIDLSRWRHDGSQPMFWTKGNGASFIDETVSKMQPLVA